MAIKNAIEREKVSCFNDIPFLITFSIAVFENSASLREKVLGLCCISVVIS